MFVETAALGGLDIQLAFYRGFGEFRVGRWTDNENELLKLMTSVFCLAGETQIGKVLQHAVNAKAYLSFTMPKLDMDIRRARLGRSCDQAVEASHHRTGRCEIAQALRVKTDIKHAIGLVVISAGLGPQPIRTQRAEQRLGYDD